jgi:phage shock protein PspC (stress-responsive transcriptional regulator)
MYSEDKKMLKGTLAGIGENIANLAVKSGVDPDRIGVFVIMDGIEKVDPSVVDYFVEL